MKKILILTAGFGDGHNAAARNLRDAIEMLDEEARTEVLDLFADSYGAFNTLARKTYLGMVQYAPSLWGGLYSVLDSPLIESQLGGFSRLQATLEKVLGETQPDCVVSTYPIYGHVLNRIYPPGHERPFRFITIVTDSISISSAWYRAPSDFYCVPNEASAEVLRAANVPSRQVKALGFPVSPVFANDVIELSPPVKGEPRRVLYIINTGKKKAGKAIDRLLEIDDIYLTIAAGTAFASGGAHKRIWRSRASVGLEQPDSRADDVASSCDQQSGWRHGAGGDCGTVSNDRESGDSGAGTGQRGSH